MTKRSPIAVFFLSILSLGIYAMVWYSKTGKELNSHGGRVPPFILNFIPPFNMIWVWEYAKGVETITQGRITAMRALLLQMTLGVMALPIFQSGFNRMAG